MDGGNPTSPSEPTDQAESGIDAAIQERLSRVDAMIARLKSSNGDSPADQSATADLKDDDPAMLKLAALAEVEAIIDAARSTAADLAQEPPEDPTTDPVEVASVMARLDAMQKGLEAEAARLLRSEEPATPVVEAPAPAAAEAEQPATNGAQAPAETAQPAATAPPAANGPPAEEDAAPPDTVVMPAVAKVVDEPTQYALPPVQMEAKAPLPTPAPATPLAREPSDPASPPSLPFGGGRYTRSATLTEARPVPETRPVQVVTPAVSRKEKRQRRRPIPFFLLLLIGVVVVCVSFAFVQGVGTRFLEHRSQHAAKAAFAKGVAVLRPGQPIGLMTASRLGIQDVAVIEGIRSSDLGRGPGHDPLSVSPGQDGVVVIAGHRTTYGGVFRHVDRFRPGDVIDLKTPAGSFRYLVVEPNVSLGPTTGTLRAPDARAIQEAGGIPQQGGRLLVLVTSSPPYRNQHRLVTVAVQTGETRTGAGILPARPANAKPSLPTFRGEPGELVIALLWLAAAIAMASLAFWLGRRRIPAPVALVIGTPFVIALLYEACLAGGRLLPQTY